MGDSICFLKTLLVLPMVPWFLWSVGQTHLKQNKKHIQYIVKSQSQWHRRPGSDTKTGVSLVRLGVRDWH